MFVLGVEIEDLEALHVLSNGDLDFPSFGRVDECGIWSSNHATKLAPGASGRDER